jgi:thiamine-phosphate pyrophosphorylase
MAFQLVGITPDILSEAQWAMVPDLFAAGLSYLYVRQAASEQVRQRLMEDSLRPFQPKILVPFSMAVGTFGRHWKEADRRAASPAERAFSTSIHALADWSTLTDRVEVVYYSPVFASVSKPGYGPTTSIDEIARQIRHIRQQTDELPLLIGLGGVQPDTIRQVQDAGFDGAAVLGTLWQSPDPVAVVQELLAKLV